jgi:hypothetical protein
MRFMFLCPTNVARITRVAPKIAISFVVHRSDGDLDTELGMDLLSFKAKTLIHARSSIIEELRQHQVR